jgi:hypothetical protein
MYKEEAIQHLKEKMTSGNHIPIERLTLSLEEYILIAGSTATPKFIPKMIKIFVEDK